MPTRVLVTGAAGTLGRHALAVLADRPALAARGLGRRPRPAEAPSRVEWIVADLLRDDLAPALRGVEALLHLASGKRPGDDDAAATRRLLEAARATGLRHAVFVSILGCDRIPLPFYEARRAVEAAVRAGGVPWSIVRVAQFHSFVERLISTTAALPIPTPLIADLRFQPVDEREAAERLVDVALGPPLGDAPDLAGPELLTLGQAAAAWLAATGRPATLVPVCTSALVHGGEGPIDPAPWARAVLEGYHAGWNSPSGARTLGRVTFAEWLARRR